MIVISRRFNPKNQGHYSQQSHSSVSPTRTPEKVVDPSTDEITRAHHSGVSTNSPVVKPYTTTSSVIAPKRASSRRTQAGVNQPELSPRSPNNTNVTPVLVPIAGSTRHHSISGVTASLGSKADDERSPVDSPALRQISPSGSPQAPMRGAVRGAPNLDPVSTSPNAMLPSSRNPEMSSSLLGYNLSLTSLFSGGGNREEQLPSIGLMGSAPQTSSPKMSSGAAQKSPITKSARKPSLGGSPVAGPGAGMAPEAPVTVRSSLFERRFGCRTSLSTDVLNDDLAVMASRAPACATLRGWWKLPLPSPTLQLGNSISLSSLSLPGDNLPSFMDIESPRLGGGNKNHRNTTKVGETLKIVSYNILSQCFVSTDNYGSCPKEALTEEHRLPLIKDELRQAGADIILLSELSAKLFSATDSLGSFLHKKLNYNGHHLSNTDLAGNIQHHCKPYTSPSATMCTTPLAPMENALMDDFHLEKIDGVGIFYERSRFEVLEEYPIFFNALGADDTHLTSEMKKNLLVKTHNVALILVLRDLSQPKWIHVVGTSHLTWRTESQIWQLHHVIKAMEKLRSKYSSYSHTPKNEEERGAPKSAEGGNAPEALGLANLTQLSNFKQAEGESVNVSCFLGGDFNMDRSHPGLEYAKNSSLPREIQQSETNSPGSSLMQPSAPPVAPPARFPPGRSPQQILSARGSGNQAKTSGSSGHLPFELPPPVVGDRKNSCRDSIPNLLGRKDEDRRSKLLLNGMENSRRVVSAGNEEDGGGAYLQMTPNVPNTPPAPTRKDMNTLAEMQANAVPIPVTCWQRSTNANDSDAAEQQDDVLGCGSPMANTKWLKEDSMGFQEEDPGPVDFDCPMSPSARPKRSRLIQTPPQEPEDWMADCGSPRGRKKKGKSPKKANPFYNPVCTPNSSLHEMMGDGIHEPEPAPPSGAIAPLEPPPRYPTGTKGLDGGKGGSCINSPSKPLQNRNWTRTAQMYHHLHFQNPYDVYFHRYPATKVSAFTGTDGTVIDHILYDHPEVTPVSVLRLAEASNPIPSWDCPSDHCMVGVIFRLGGT